MRRLLPRWLCGCLFLSHDASRYPATPWGRIVVACLIVVMLVLVPLQVNNFAEMFEQGSSAVRNDSHLNGVWTVCSQPPTCVTVGCGAHCCLCLWKRSDSQLDDMQYTLDALSTDIRGKLGLASLPPRQLPNESVSSELTPRHQASLDWATQSVSHVHLCAFVCVCFSPHASCGVLAGADCAAHKHRRSALPVQGVGASFPKPRRQFTLRRASAVLPGHTRQ